MTPTPAGKFRHVVTLRQPVANRAPDGEDVQTFDAGSQRYACIEPLAGRWLALAQANATTATATHRVILRYSPDVKVTSVLDYQGTRFRINAVVDVEMAHRELHLTVTATPGDPPVNP